MCTRIHVYKYTYMWTYIHIHIYIHIHVYTYTPTHFHTCTHTYRIYRHYQSIQTTSMDSVNKPTFSISIKTTCLTLRYPSVTLSVCHSWHFLYTGWRRLIGSPKLQIIFYKRATKYRALLLKMTYKDKGSYGSSPPCTSRISFVTFPMSLSCHHSSLLVYGGGYSQ